jgi:shikimate dehydrogenase
MSLKQRFAVLGHPVSHSVSPAMHRAAFKALKLPHSYEAIDVPNVDRLKELVDALRQGFFTGLNITVPHKRNVVAFADRADGSVTQLGAANTLV